MWFWTKLGPNHKFGLESNETYLKDTAIPLYRDYIYVKEFLNCSSSHIPDCFFLCTFFYFFLFCAFYLVPLLYLIIYTKKCCMHLLIPNFSSFLFLWKFFIHFFKKGVMVLNLWWLENVLHKLHISAIVPCAYV